VRERELDDQLAVAFDHVEHVYVARIQVLRLQVVLASALVGHARGVGSPAKYRLPLPTETRESLEHVLGVGEYVPEPLDAGFLDAIRVGEHANRLPPHRDERRF